MRLFALRTYFAASERERDKVCNGCGSRGITEAVPDTLWGLKVTEVCNIHDWSYEYANSRMDRFIADILFLVNLVLWIKERGSGWLNYARFYRAMTYFVAVRALGGFTGEFVDDGSRDTQNPFLGVIYGEIEE